MAPTPPHPPRYALTSLLAPLGEVSPDRRWLHPYADWLLPADGAPVVPLDTLEPVGQIRVLVKRQGWLVGLGYVDATNVEAIEAMRADKLRPQIELDSFPAATVDSQVAEPADGDPLLRFYGGTIRAVMAGDMPAFPDARFVIGAHVEEDVAALGTHEHPTLLYGKPRFQVFSYHPNGPQQTDHGQTTDRLEAEEMCRREVIRGARSAHVLRICPDPGMVYQYDITDMATVR